MIFLPVFFRSLNIFIFKINGHKTTLKLLVCRYKSYPLASKNKNIKSSGKPISNTVN